MVKKLSKYDMDYILYKSFFKEAKTGRISNITPLSILMIN